MDLEFDPRLFDALEGEGRNREFNVFRKAYVERKPFYEKALLQIMQDLKEIKRRHAKEAKLRIAYIDGRIKDAGSTIRKAYKKGIPAEKVFDEIEDILGIRVVLNNLKDVQALVEEIQSLADISVLEQEEHKDEQGYRALHLKATCSLDYEGQIHKIIFEIQIRSILQDAWAMLMHHDEYKNKADLPRLAKSISRHMSHLLGALDHIADDFRDELETKVDAPNDLSDSAALDKEGIAFLFFELFGKNPEEYDIQYLKKRAEGLEIGSVGTARKGLTEEVFENLRKINKKYFPLDASNNDLFEYGLIYAILGKRAYSIFGKKASAELDEIKARNRAEILSSMPETFEEFLEMIEYEGIPWDVTKELGGLEGCAFCGTGVLDPEEAADGILSYYGYPETDINLEEIFRDSDDIDAPEVGGFNRPDLCSWCDHILSKDD